MNELLISIGVAILLTLLIGLGITGVLGWNEHVERLHEEGNSSKATRVTLYPMLIIGVIFLLIGLLI